MQPLLEVKDLRTSFFTDAGEVRAVDGVSFAVEPGKLMGLVGESGSGKTASVLSVMRLLPERARVTGGAVLFEGRDLLKLSEPEMRAVRGAVFVLVQCGTVSLRHALQVCLILRSVIWRRRVQRSAAPHRRRGPRS